MSNYPNAIRPAENPLVPNASFTANNAIEEYGSGLDGLVHTTPKSGPDLSHGIALYLEEVDVWFDSFQALNNLSLYIEEGELRCIIGPNGAGKTTLMDVITGKTRPTSGTCLLYTSPSPRD